MSSREEVTLPATRPKSRKSLAHIPSAQEMDQENMTADLGALASGKRAVPIEKPTKKSRSKSIGPGGLDALKDTTGNRRKVWDLSQFMNYKSNITQVSGYCPPPTPEIYPKAYYATSPRDSGAYIYSQNKSKENNPAISTEDRESDRFRYRSCSWRNYHWYK